MLRYGGPFAFLASVPLLYYGVAPAAPFITIAALLLALAGSELPFPAATRRCWPISAASARWFCYIFHFSSA